VSHSCSWCIGAVPVREIVETLRVDGPPLCGPASTRVNRIRRTSRCSRRPQAHVPSLLNATPSGGEGGRWRGSGDAGRLRVPTNAGQGPGRKPGPEAEGAGVVGRNGRKDEGRARMAPEEHWFFPARSRHPHAKTVPSGTRRHRPAVVGARKEATANTPHRCDSFSGTTEAFWKRCSGVLVPRQAGASYG